MAKANKKVKKDKYVVVHYFIDLTRQEQGISMREIHSLNLLIKR
jgi:hypothetical protein